MEITYDTGAKVILQGPVTYEVESKDGGYLSLGKLTAKLEKGVRVGVQNAEKSLIPHPSSLIPLFPSALPPPPLPTWAPSSAWKSVAKALRIHRFSSGKCKLPPRAANAAATGKRG